MTTSTSGRAAPERRFDLAIIGGGIVGCAIARELSRYDLDTVLIERAADVGFGTSKANSGIIHAGHHAAIGSLKGRLEWAGNRMWGALAEELGISFDRVGDLTVAFDADEVAILRELCERAEERGVTGVEMWGQARVQDEEPALSDEVLAAVHGPTAGVVNPYEACFALADDAVANGVTLQLDALVTGIARTSGGFSVGTTRGEFGADVIVNAAGLAADRVEAMVGLETFRLTGRKGEEYLLDKRLRGMVKRIIFPCPTPTSKGILVIPTFDGTLMVGPTAHPAGDRDDTTTTADGAREVFESVQRLVPGISAGDCIAEFAGVRAVTDTGDFVVGATEVPGFVNAAGIQSPGLTAAPAIAELIRDDLVAHGLDLRRKERWVAPSLPPTPMRSSDRTEQIERSAADPAFGRVICRCELVTEGEVVDAIERGGHTLDGIKFRTRAGMGRCQGSFCTWRVMELIASELGMPIAEVTKRGGGSWMVLDRDQFHDERSGEPVEVGVSP
ncbi:MAG: NAD(P)/FAD-dependent oxidoreductase [Ilumatobacter sp.]|uniref:NAD(P)/FAD-dependent oxidoreductase n=1 Tax=Ilumatobacter sp. TaxID=1967498 RepID=UPI00262E35B9|nr:NAD(P)/FAD-dependent oxidoreductase [Ilumatobacter sp.]MDJ0770565.1 NAD(P)/FAD-dependent oxidoreductase [Ilumatobacter sp.]